jgi:ADP-glucose pyrophosphorylase
VKIRRAILDENVTVQDGECIGHDLEHDRIRHHVTATGIVVVTSCASPKLHPGSAVGNLHRS